MKYLSLAAILACGLTAACTVKTERTVVERPVATPTAGGYAESPPPTTTYVVPAN